MVIFILGKSDEWIIVPWSFRIVTCAMAVDGPTVCPTIGSKILQGGKHPESPRGTYTHTHTRVYDTFIFIASIVDSKRSLEIVLPLCFWE